MKHILPWLVIALMVTACGSPIDPSEFKTPFESSDSTETATYEQAMAWWKKLERASGDVSIRAFGSTDAGKQLHLVIVNTGQNFSRAHITGSGKTICLINNAIHPGEPDGVDASMLLVRDLLSSEEGRAKLENTVLLIIPFYNVGGALNRNCCSRANQNGPSSYGFRGNARNLDLNRDFIKADSRNARSFAQAFRDWNPDVYLETHVSNGADYPYTMTYLISHPDKLTPPMDDAMRDLFAQPLERAMSESGDPMTPYVNVFGTTPDSGFHAFYDSPRYSTGFAALHHSFGLLTETHMLKPFKQRVASTLRFMHHLVNVLEHNGEAIQMSRKHAMQFDRSSSSYITHWQTDTTQYSKLLFKGYAASYDTSVVTGAPQLHYDQSRQWVREIKYYDRLSPVTTVEAPRAYLVPYAWKEVIDRLVDNGVELWPLKRDTLLTCGVYEVMDYQTASQPREGHYYHYDTRVEKRIRPMQILQGTYAQVSLDQPSRRFIIEVLEPEGPDSYFNWNFFDEILQQKEWFSPYVFEKEAEEMLKDPAHRDAFDAFLELNPAMRDEPMAQLYFLYKRSDHFEKDRYMVYPVYRVE